MNAVQIRQALRTLSVFLLAVAASAPVTQAQKASQAQAASNVLWRGATDMDGDGELDVITITAQSPELLREAADDYPDGCVSASTPDQRCRATISVGDQTAEIVVNWLPLGEHGVPIEVRIVDIDPTDGRQELIIDQAGRQEEDPWREFTAVLYDGKRLTVQPLWYSTGYDAGHIEVMQGQVRTTYDDCPTKTIVTYRLDADGLRLVETGRVEHQSSEMCVACPTVYVQVGESEQRMGEVLRHMDAAHKKGWQPVRLFVLADDRLEVIIREEKEETTFLDAVRLEVDGRHYLPTSCQQDVLAPWCEADGDVHVMNTGDELRLTFELDGPIGASSVPRLIANGHYIPLR